MDCNCVKLRISVQQRMSETNEEMRWGTDKNKVFAIFEYP